MIVKTSGVFRNTVVILGKTESFYYKDREIALLSAESFKESGYNVKEVAKRCIVEWSTFNESSPNSLCVCGSVSCYGCSCE